MIDTNVLLSALTTKNKEAATVKVLDALLDGKIIALYHMDILTEYRDVLHRRKFHIDEELITDLLDTVQAYGVEVFPKPTGEIFVDMDDLIFYEVAMEKREEDAYLVTGNQKHYPVRDFIVTPAEMVEIMQNQI